MPALEDPGAGPKVAVEGGASSLLYVIPYLARGRKRHTGVTGSWFRHVKHQAGCWYGPCVCVRGAGGERRYLDPSLRCSRVAAVSERYNPRDWFSLPVTSGVSCRRFDCKTRRGTHSVRTHDPSLTPGLRREPTPPMQAGVLHVRRLAVRTGGPPRAGAAPFGGTAHLAQRALQG